MNKYHLIFPLFFALSTSSSYAQDMKLFDEDHELPCNSSFEDPSHIFRITISPSTDGSLFLAHIEEYDSITGNYITHNYGPPDGIMTPFSVNLRMSDKASNGKPKREFAEIEYVIDNTTPLSEGWEFYDRGKAISSPIGKKNTFICEHRRTVDNKKVTARVKYKKNSRVPLRMGYNINLNILQPDKTQLPITIDPEVKNHG